MSSVRISMKRHAEDPFPGLLEVNRWRKLCYDKMLVERLITPLEQPSMSTWPLPNSPENRSICDNVHGSITVFYPLNTLMDSEEFQRLREIKQIGLCHLVYPSGDHKRFTHSLGAYWLAYLYVEKLKYRYSQLSITPADHLCISVAAFCHDIGHGPFSHLFDQAFAEVSSRRIKHETLSILIVRRLFAKESVRKAFTPFLGEGEEFQKNIKFIEELISPKLFDENNNKWLPEGRPLEKSFLYDIVSNDNDSIDVDKWDYLLRDSVCSGTTVSFDRTSIDRIMDGARVLEDPQKKFKRICFSKKLFDSIMLVGEGRQQLHEKVYQHKTVKAIEYLVVDAMKNAVDLKFEGDDGVMRDLSHVTEDLGSYLKTDDTIITQIRLSTSDAMKRSRDIIRLIDNRELPRLLDEIVYSPEMAEKFCKNNPGGSDQCGGGDWQQSVKAVVEKKMGQEFGDKFFLITRNMNRGCGKVNPLTRVLFYDHKEVDPVPYPASKELLELKAPKFSSILTLAVYCIRDCPPEVSEAIKTKFRQITLDGHLRHQ